MSRYINADWLISLYKPYDGYKGREWATSIATILANIEDAPSIDIVRCKECKYYDKFPTWSACTYWSGDPYEQASVNPNDFCSYGEREGE